MPEQLLVVSQVQPGFHGHEQEYPFNQEQVAPLLQEPLAHRALQAPQGQQVQVVLAHQGQQEQVVLAHQEKHVTQVENLGLLALDRRWKKQPESRLQCLLVYQPSPAQMLAQMLALDVLRRQE